MMWESPSLFDFLSKMSLVEKQLRNLFQKRNEFNQKYKKGSVSSRLQRIDEGFGQDDQR